MAEGRREALRVDLHRYAHLQAEPDLKVQYYVKYIDLCACYSEGTALVGVLRRGDSYPSHPFNPTPLLTPSSAP